MHEIHLQKTHMLSEAADQQPANSIKFFSATGSPPTPYQTISQTVVVIVVSSNHLFSDKRNDT